MTEEYQTCLTDLPKLAIDKIYDNLDIRSRVLFNIALPREMKVIYTDMCFYEQDLYLGAVLYGLILSFKTGTNIVYPMSNIRFLTSLFKNEDPTREIINQSFSQEMIQSYRGGDLEESIKGQVSALKSALRILKH